MTSVLTWQQLRDLKLTELDDAADGWATVSQHADSAGQRVDAEMAGRLSKTQESQSADAAVRRLNRLSDNYHYIHAEAGLIRSAVDGLSAELSTPQRHLRAALDDAAALSFTVNEDGSVAYPKGKNDTTGEEVPGGKVVGNDGTLLPSNKGLYPPDVHGHYVPGTGPAAPHLIGVNPNFAKAQDIADRIARAVREAGEIDERYRQVLIKLKAGPGLKVDAKTWADAAADVKAVGDAEAHRLRDAVPLDKSPADRKKWWDHLTQEQREEYLAVYPDMIGNLDGIPAAARNQAKRENIDLLIGKLSGKDDERSKIMLDGLKAIEDQLKHPDPKFPPMYLLGIGDTGNGRAIVSYGNPDTAKNVSAYVPGLGTALDTDFARNDLKRARDTARDAQFYNPSSASIVWLGYDAPQVSPSEGVHNADVMSTHDARVGATAYNHFMAGISATNDHEDPHITAIGHSYGSLTVGQAAQRHGGIPGADDIILVGSPGTGADKAEDLNVGRDHVFVGAADHDPVTMLPSHREAAGIGMGSYMGAVEGALLGHLSGENVVDQMKDVALGAGAGGYVGYGIGHSTSDPDELWFGTDPASKDFGARRFHVDPGPVPSIHDPAPAHSNYFNPEKDKESANNIALIVAGHSDQIQVEKPR
ncbi:alpha/beta hydrolase [Streptomyces sp. AM6-12]|uniref:alpha/beta hydrolase n=1 Tax=Streptomyces sp. AM6-12 TaxID=3345149 RepID=UPI00378836BD